ncbi:DNA mismatch repair protein Msh3-like isoform X3 [Porites lutea]|uniref:DNA mismatch repair protein Msh3-like isoform X3 n=1 Tax=Porites lutea TaxID=51062 RepID=UPI003CC57E42
MKKLNLGKLRCSTASSSKGYPSSSRSSTKTQSQATISSFFINKSCSKDENKVTAKSAKSTVKRTAARILLHDGDDGDSQNNCKKQRFDTELLSTQDDKSHDPLTSTDKEVIRPSTMTKLSCFRKDSNVKDSSTKNEHSRAQNSKECVDDNMELDDDMDRTNLSSGCSFSGDNMDDVKDMDVKKTENLQKVRPNLEQFACASRPASCKTKLTLTEKSEPNGSKSFNLKPKLAYTPLELQFVEVKSNYPDVILFVECGYRYRFFGEDAEIAAKELNIFCHVDHNFQTASIPTHRLHVHVKRLVSKGYKVGVVKQTETAALKAAGENKSKVFTRKLHALYTKTTLVGEDLKMLDDLEETQDSVEMGSGYLMCLVETNLNDKKTSSDMVKRTFGLVAVQPSTGDVIYDEFEDGPGFTELETHFEHISPEELLLPESVSESTNTFIKEYVTRLQRPEDSIRLEKMADQLYEESAVLTQITKFYDQPLPERNPQLCKVNIERESPLNADQETSTALEVLLNLPKSVRMCFAALIQYLQDFKLEKILRLTSNFSKFSIQNKFVKLSGQTLRNLEIFKNQTNGSEKSSLFWVINHTTTAFGRRLLKKWISRPLRTVSAIEERLSAVTELCSPNSSCLSHVKGLLSQLPDLERGLCTIFHKKCTPAEFVTITKSLVNVAKHLQSNQQVATTKLESPLLRSIFAEIPNYLNDVGDFLKLVNEKAAKEGDKTRLFDDLTQFPEIMKCNLFLIEVRNANLRMVPSDWIKISATKQVSRFRTPFVEEKFKILCQWREQLSIAAQEAWLEFLALFSEGCSRYRRAVHCIATLDCLFSLAAVAKQPGFVRPFVRDCESHIYIKQGRHPVIDNLLPENEQFVPNDTDMNVNDNRCMIITGPNMGGKSSYIKQVALIVILAQTGSYVPAEEAKVGVLDAVFTRMGASDNIYKGQSTFMVELQETSDIIAQATPKSLVILDELGRGTSTHDGTAIAYATLHHFISKVSSLTLFVTHYPSLAELEVAFPKHVTNNHMAFMTSQEQQTDQQCPEGGKEESIPSVTFLYHVVNGAAARSYGLNVARLAGIPSEILNTAAKKSHELEHQITHRRDMKTIFQDICSSSSVTPESIKNLRDSLTTFAPG